MPAEAGVLTVELKANLLAPARSGTVKARGEVLKTGRTLTVCHGDAFEVVGDEEIHVATMIATMITREEDPAAPASLG
jgi:acyl-coenzyme A thioesterase PaaI-like protein